MIVYLNGKFLPQEEATISPTDRGFLFGDGIYEAIPFYKGKPFAMEGHWKRLQEGLAFLRIDFFDDRDKMLQVFDTLLSKNGMNTAPRSMIYLQITRGAPPKRSHVFPTNTNGTIVKPTVFSYCQELSFPSPERWNQGFAAVLVPDQRWGRVDIKTVNLLANVLAAQEAEEKDADVAIFVLDKEIVTEGASVNVFAVLEGGTIVTHPLSNRILPGITRNKVVEVARNAGLVVEERPLSVTELCQQAQEVFMTSTTSEIKPVVSIDGKPVGKGVAGEMTKRLLSLLRTQIQKETGVVVE